MEKRDDFTFKAIIGTVLALMFSLGIFIIANIIVPFRLLGPRPEAQEAMQNIFLIHTGISVVMLGLSVYLLFIYLKDYLHLKSRFTLGLLIAVFSFMLFALAANPLLHILFGIYGGRGIFSLVPHLFATASLAILVWVSSR